MTSRLAPLPHRPVTVRKRRTIPLSIRYEVLRRQCDPAKVQEIEAKGGKLKDKYSRLLLHARCALSDEELIVKGCEFDHRIPRALGGSDDADNIQALTPAAHRKKTDADDARIAKAKRQAGETGQRARREEHGSQFQRKRKWAERIKKQKALTER